LKKTNSNPREILKVYFYYSTGKVKLDILKLDFKDKKNTNDKFIA